MLAGRNANVVINRANHFTVHILVVGYSIRQHSSYSSTKPYLQLLSGNKMYGLDNCCATRAKSEDTSLQGFLIVMVAVML